MLQAFVNHLAPLIPFRTKCFICCFNQLDKAKIVVGFKNAFTEEEVMTGKEFCEILGIDYDKIIELRKNDTSDNFQYVVEKMTEIPEVKKAVVVEQRKHIVQNEFYDDQDAEECADENT